MVWNDSARCLELALCGIPAICSSRPDSCPDADYDGLEALDQCELICILHISSSGKPRVVEAAFLSFRHLLLVWSMHLLHHHHINLHAASPNASFSSRECVFTPPRK